MIKILHISDIHYGWKKPEEDGEPCLSSTAKEKQRLVYGDVIVI